MRIVVSALVVAALVGAFLAGRASRDGGCGRSEVRLDGECEAIRPGKPSVRNAERRAESVASVATDGDPAADTLFAHCAFQGVAAGRVDVHMCVVSYVGAPIVLRVENDRGTGHYRVVLVSDPEGEAFATEDPGDDGVVECELPNAGICED